MFDSVNARLAAFMALFKVQIRVAQGIERRRKQERQSMREAESEQGVKSTAEERSTKTDGDGNHGTHKRKQWLCVGCERNRGVV